MPSRPGVIGRPGWCKWCDSEILNPATGKPHRQRMWHPDCADEHQLYTRAEVAREFLIGRDGDRCRECGAEDRGRWIAGPVVRVLSLSWQSRWGLDLWERPEGLSVGDYRPGGRFEFLGGLQDIQGATALRVDAAGLTNESRYHYVWVRLGGEEFAIIAASVREFLLL